MFVEEFQKHTCKRISLFLVVKHVWKSKGANTNIVIHTATFTRCHSFAWCIYRSHVQIFCACAAVNAFSLTDSGFDDVRNCEDAGLKNAMCLEVAEVDCSGTLNEVWRQMCAEECKNIGTIKNLSTSCYVTFNVHCVRNLEHGSKWS